MSRGSATSLKLRANMLDWAIATTLPRSLRDADAITTFISINALGGFGAPSDGGGKDPRKPGDEAPEEWHYAEAPTLNKD